MNLIKYSLLTIVLLSFCLISIVNCQEEDRESKRLSLGNKDKEVCYNEYGCFTKAVANDELKTLGSHFPEPPEKVNVHFSVFSCQDRYNPSVVPWNSPDNKYRDLNYDPKRRTVILIHGYTDFYDQFNWMGDAKDFILRSKPCNLNVVLTDWSGGSQVPNYMVAVANTRLVGAIVASFITKMNKAYGTTNDHFTVIGHSLGAQISGFTGKRFQRGQKLRNIIGLDPAGPAFAKNPQEERLNPNDAELVLSIHSNGGINVIDGLGLLIPSGHYSFYPNGGEEQPGCGKIKSVLNILNKGLAEGIADVGACSHLRAYLLFQFDESQYDEFESVAYRCDSYKNFTAGRCGQCRDGSDDCRPFGRWFDYWQEQKPSREWKEPVKLYTETRQQLPYSYFLYQVIVKTGDHFKSYKGNLFLNVTGSFRRDFSEKIHMDRTFEPNREYTFLHKSLKSIGRIEFINASLMDASATLSTGATGGLLRGLLNNKNKAGDGDDGINVREIQINYMNGYTESKRRSLSSVLRSDDGQTMIRKGEITSFRTSRTNGTSNGSNFSGNNNNRRKPDQNQNNQNNRKPSNNNQQNNTNSGNRRPGNNNNQGNIDDDSQRPSNNNNNNSQNNNRRPGNNNNQGNINDDNRRPSNNNQQNSNNNSSNRRPVNNQNDFDDDNRRPNNNNQQNNNSGNRRPVNNQNDFDDDNRRPGNNNSGNQRPGNINDDNRRPNNNNQQQNNNNSNRRPNNNQQQQNNQFDDSRRPLTNF